MMQDASLEEEEERTSAFVTINGTLENNETKIKKIIFVKLVKQSNKGFLK